MDIHNDPAVAIEITTDTAASSFFSSTLLPTFGHKRTHDFRRGSQTTDTRGTTWEAESFVLHVPS